MRWWESKVKMQCGGGGLPLSPWPEGPELGSQGAGSRVTSLACSWVPREAEEPGKETEKSLPSPSPEAWGLGE